MDQDASDSGRYQFNNPDTGDRVFPPRAELAEGESGYDVFVSDLQVSSIEFVTRLVRQGMSPGRAEQVAQNLPCFVKRGVPMLVARQYLNVFEHAGATVSLVEVLMRSVDRGNFLTVPPHVEEPPSHAAETMIPNRNEERPFIMPPPAQPSPLIAQPLPPAPVHGDADNRGNADAENWGGIDLPSVALPAAPLANAESVPPFELTVGEGSGVSIVGLADLPDAVEKELTPDMIHRGPSAEFLPLAARVVSPVQPQDLARGSNELELAEVWQPRSQFENVGKVREAEPDFQMFEPGRDAPRGRRQLPSFVPRLLIVFFIGLFGTYVYGCVDVTTNVGKFNSNLGDLNRRLENMNARNRVVSEADIHEAVSKIAAEANMTVRDVDIIAERIGTVRMGGACQFAHFPDTIRQLAVSERARVMKSRGTCSIPDYILTIKIKARARFLYVTRNAEVYRVTTVNKYDPR